MRQKHRIISSFSLIIFSFFSFFPFPNSLVIFFLFSFSEWFEFFSFLFFNFFIWKNVLFLPSKNIGKSPRKIQRVSLRFCSLKTEKGKKKKKWRNKEKKKKISFEIFYFSIFFPFLFHCFSPFVVRGQCFSLCVFYKIFSLKLYFILTFIYHLFNIYFQNYLQNQWNKK